MNARRDTLPITIATLRKNARESILVRLCEYEGRPFIDARVLDIANGEAPTFTKKGIAFHPRLTSELVAAIEKACRQARELGLLNDGAA